MLTPRQLDHYPDRLVELYAQVEADILADMARKINAYNYYTAASAHQKQKLRELGNTYDDIMKRLSAVSGKSKEELRRIMQEAGTEALKNDDDIYKAAGLSPGNVNQSPALLNVLNAGLKKTKGTFDNLTKTTANTATKQFEHALDRAYMQITTGAFSPQAAIKIAIKDLAKDGLNAIEYPSGHIDHLDVAVRRAVITGVNQTAATLQITRANEMGCDLVEVTAHAGARPSHAVWQGGIYSLSGQSKEYAGLEEATGYGTGAGLCGWNCRHSFFPYYPGIRRPAYTPEELEQFNAKTYEYNGVQMTEYEATQKQRYIERQIRRWKREEQAMDAAGLPTEEAKAKVAHWKAMQKDYLAKTGLKRQYDREWIAKSTLQAVHNEEIKISKKAVQNAFTVDRQLVNSKAYHDKFEQLPLNKNAAESVYRNAKKILEQRDGTRLESMIVLDARTGEEIVSNMIGGIEGRTGLSDAEYETFKKHKGKVILLHNHPEGRRLSITDIMTMAKESKVEASIVVGHDGSVHCISNLNRKYDIARHYNLVYNKYKDIDAIKDVAIAKATTEIYEAKVFDYIEL